MKRRRIRLSPVLLFALAATFGVAFAPTISRIVLPSQATICSAMATGNVMASMATAMPDPDATSRSKSPGLLDHCELCGVAALPCVTTHRASPVDVSTASYARPITPRPSASVARIEWSPATWHGPPALV